ncbi:hypothetical protein BS47DRAFT_515130 [Hydnum rufescens UP504]|uniref:MARVEL domain-containing protein n=1 Tax=Hydnum rufescens UP504 TaxID=1448309 RepID=A0A9P6DNY1_9AGAM|nr:hypothetical protein BS47DRAFT_515130 [Hydnum rufescens UP504]
MSIPYVIISRVFLLGLLFSSNAVILVLSAIVFSLSDQHNRYASIFLYWIFLSCFTLISILFLVLADVARQGALAFRVIFEVAWLVVFWMMHLAGASAVTATGKCQVSEACSSSQRSLTAFSWLSVCNLLAHLGMLLFSSIAHVDVQPNVWIMGVREVPWFEHRHVAPSTAFGNSVKSPPDEGPQPQVENIPAIPLFPEENSWHRGFLDDSAASPRHQNSAYPFQSRGSMQRSGSLRQKFMPQWHQHLQPIARPIPQRLPPSVPFAIQRLVPIQENHLTSPLHPEDQPFPRANSPVTSTSPFPEPQSLAPVSSHVLNPVSRNIEASPPNDPGTHSTLYSYRYPQQRLYQPPFSTIPPPPSPSHRSYPRPLLQSLKPLSSEVRDVNEFYSAHVQSVLRNHSLFPQGRERDRHADREAFLVDGSPD